MRRFLLSLACGLSAMAAAGDAGASEPQQPARQTPDFIQFFDALALTADYGPFNNRPPWVRKWAAAVRIVLDEPAESLRGEIAELLGRLAGWTELPLELAPRGTAVASDDINVITVKLLPRPVFQRLYRTRDVVCQTETHGVGGLLQVGYMVVSEGYTDCLKHEFMHALGFDSHWYPKSGSEIRSVLAYRDSPARSEDYSPWDIMAIRVLYDRRIRAGMNRQKSLTIAYEVIGERPQSAALTTGSGGASTFR